MIRKYIILLSIMLLLACTGIGAETVCVIIDSPKTGEIGRNSQYLRLVEEGLMSTFFDAGHIAFNTAPANVENYIAKNDALAGPVMLARSGGATRLVIAHLDYYTESENKNVFPQAVNFKLVNVDNSAVIGKGRLQADNETEIETSEKEFMSKDEKRFYLFGEKIANNVLNIW